MEEKDIKIIEDFNYNFLTATRLKVDMPITMYITDEIHDTIMKLLQAYKQDEKVIHEMAKSIVSNDSNLCEYLDIANKCKYYAGENKKCCDTCIIDYFRKKCE